MPGLPNAGVNYQMFKHADALSEKEKKQYAQLLQSVLKTASEQTIVEKIAINNRLRPDQGREGKLIDWGEYVAFEKPEGQATGMQSLVPDTIKWPLKRWEIKVGLSDESMEESGESPNAYLNKGQAARAFQRRWDAVMLTEYKTNAPGTAGTDWSTESEANIVKQITGALDEVNDLGFKVNMAIMTNKQRSKIKQFESVVKGWTTVDEYIKENLEIANHIAVRKIRIKDENNVYQDIYDQTGRFMLLQTDAAGVFSQKPTMMEPFRDKERGISGVIMRKDFGGKLIQAEAIHQLTGLVI
jgi:hypothetical protein